ncbi:hypothetical protein VNI00_006379 [Paramarasmius palmivorus]|uniref:FHA domain-containing protein n=1 Tax=Paramarasmius palmivorus TaxID=297713 RepID=A0AAW0D8R1_9AGAR
MLAPIQQFPSLNRPPPSPVRSTSKRELAAILLPVNRQATAPKMIGDDIEYIGTKMGGGGMLSITSPRTLTGVTLHVESTTSEAARRMVFHSTTKPIHVGRSPSTNDESSRRSDQDQEAALFRCPVVSRNHATIIFDDNKVFVTDVKSHHGTHIRRLGSLTSTMLKPLTPMQVADGDYITFGKTVGSKSHETVKPVVVRVEHLYDDPSFPTRFFTPTPTRNTENNSSPKSSSGRYGVFSDSSSVSSSSSSQSSDEMDISSSSEDDSEIEELPGPGPVAPLRVTSLVGRTAGAFKKLLDNMPHRSDDIPSPVDCGFTDPSLTCPPTPIQPPTQTPTPESSQPFRFGSPFSSAMFTFKVPSMLNNLPFQRRPSSSPLWSNDADIGDAGRDSAHQPNTSPWYFGPSFSDQHESNSVQGTPYQSNVTSVPESSGSNTQSCTKRDLLRRRSKSRSPMDLATPSPQPPSQGPSWCSADGSIPEQAQVSQSEIADSPSLSVDVPQSMPQTHVLPLPEDSGLLAESLSSSTPAVVPDSEVSLLAFAQWEDPWGCNRGAEEDSIPLVEPTPQSSAAMNAVEPTTPEEAEEHVSQSGDNDTSNTELESIKNDITQLHALRRKYKARFNANVSITQQHLNSVRNNMAEVKSSHETLSNQVTKDVSDLQGELATVQSRVDGMQGMINDVAMDVDQVKNDSLQKAKEMKKQIEDVQMHVDTLDKICSEKICSVEAELAEGKRLVQELKDLYNDMKQLREDNMQAMDVEISALKQARVDAEGELRTVTDLRTKMEVAAQEAEATIAAASQVGIPHHPVMLFNPDPVQMAQASLKRKRDDADVGGEGETTSSALVDDERNEPCENVRKMKPAVLGGTSVDGVELSPTSAITTVTKNIDGTDVPSRKRARKVVKVIAKTTTAITIGAVAAWTALAFS